MYSRPYADFHPGTVDTVVKLSKYIDALSGKPTIHSVRVDVSEGTETRVSNAAGGNKVPLSGK